MSDPDTIRLRHMFDAAQEAISFLEGKSRISLESDRLLVLGLVKEIEIIGEAASRMSEERRNSLSEIPWADIIGMRNRLIHAYFDVNVDIIWDVVSHDLPSLVNQIEASLSENEIS